MTHRPTVYVQHNSSAVLLLLQELNTNVCMLHDRYVMPTSEPAYCEQTPRLPESLLFSNN